jgi:hypothetical protein
LFFTALLAICCTATGLDTPAASANTPAPVAASAANSSDSSVAHSRNLFHELPDAPIAKSAASRVDESTAPSPENISPVQQPLFVSLIKPSGRSSYETARQRKIWFGLIAASHGAAGFDAWSTRRALSGGYGTEADPLLRPFAHSGALYAATQVSPLVMDYLGYRMMNSHHSMIRKLWWVPQVAGTSVSLSAGIHNYRLGH